MSFPKSYQGYKSFAYLQPNVDYPTFTLAAEIDRVAPSLIDLTAEQEKQLEEVIRQNVFISMHEHLCIFPEQATDTPAYVRAGRTATAYEGLSLSYWDAVFDNLLNGLCQIHSHSGWQWDDIIHDLGMRLCDIAHQDFIIHGKEVADIHRAHKEGKVAWIATLEGAAMIEHEIDRLDILYGLGIRSMGITYSESNALGSGLKEPRDGGLTTFGRRAVERMNKLGILIDCSHTGDLTALDTIEASTKPIVLSHIGARTLWDSRRLAPDDVIKACAAKGGIIGVEAAPHTTLTYNRRVHDIETVMEHFEYIKDLVGIDHVSFGPDTTYGDHVGLHHAYTSSLSLNATKQPDRPGMEYEEVAYVEGLENPTEASHNIARWLIREGYSDEDIAKVMGGNVLRVLSEAWYV